MRKELYRARELDQRVKFLREVKTPDGMGGAEASWQEIAEVWAKVRPMSGRQREHADRLNAESNYVFVIRYRSDITENDVAEWKGTRFNLRFAKDRPRSRFLEIEAEKGVPV